MQWRLRLVRGPGGARRGVTDDRPECVGHFDEPQCVVVCPVECIDPDPDIPETQDALLAKLHGLQRDHPELYVTEFLPK